MYNFQEGEVLLIDKPYKWTSFDVVKKIRYLIKVKKVGHAGTLDPLATGLMILCTGKATKKINELQGLDKEYKCEIELGKTTPSYDLETEFNSEKDISGLAEEQIREVIKSFEGEIMQTPPIYSALRVKGERAYKSARKGEDIKLDPRPVNIKSLEIVNIDLPKVELLVTCSKGTYIRSLANDIGEKLGVGGYLASLKRTKVGEFKIEDSKSIEQFVGEVAALN